MRPEDGIVWSVGGNLGDKRAEDATAVAKQYRVALISPGNDHVVVERVEADGPAQLQEGRRAREALPQADAAHQLAIRRIRTKPDIVVGNEADRFLRLANNGDVAIRGDRHRIQLLKLAVGRRQRRVAKTDAPYVLPIVVELGENSEAWVGRERPAH